MTSLSKEVVLAFCKHCDWAYQSWLLRKHLFDDNPRQDLLKHPHHAFLFTRLALILQEYWLHEVAKLHDSAIQGGKTNLSVNYILNYGDWSPELKDKLSALANRLSILSGAIRQARNKLLSHNDLVVILSGTSLGEFNDGTDVDYFGALQDFVDSVHNERIGGPFPFDDLTVNDVIGFMATFGKGVAQQPVAGDACRRA